MHGNVILRNGLRTYSNLYANHGFSVRCFACQVIIRGGKLDRRLYSWCWQSWKMGEKNLNKAQLWSSGIKTCKGGRENWNEKEGSRMKEIEEMKSMWLYRKISALRYKFRLCLKKKGIRCSKSDSIEYQQRYINKFTPLKGVYASE